MADVEVVVVADVAMWTETVSAESICRAEVKGWRGEVAEEVATALGAAVLTGTEFDAMVAAGSAVALVRIEPALKTPTEIGLLHEVDEIRYIEAHPHEAYRVDAMEAARPTPRAAVRTVAAHLKAVAEFTG